MTRLTHIMLRALMDSNGVVQDIPELAAAVTTYKSARAVTGGCSACQKRGRETTALEAAREVVVSLPPEKLAAAKRRMGVHGQDLVSYRRLPDGNYTQAVI